jgi:hypothetical protein
MLRFIFSLFMGTIIVTLLVLYVIALIEIIRAKYKQKWMKIVYYLLITFVPVIGLIIYKFTKKMVK